MNEILISDTINITTLDFESLKEKLMAKLAEYDSLVYTESNIAEARKDATYLNKQKQILEGALREFKKQCMEPYDEIAPKVNELTKMIEAQRQKIKEIDDAYKTNLAAEKEKQVRAYYDRKSGELGEFAAPLYEKIFQKSWTNASTPKAKYETAVLIAINQAGKDIAEIKALNSPFVDTLLNVYIDTLSLEKVNEKLAELEDSVKKAGFSQDLTALEAKKEDKKAYSDKEDAAIQLKVFANEKQLSQILDFMRIIGVNFELQ